MAKGQKRSNREAKKPKKEKVKQPLVIAVPPGKGTASSSGASKK